MIIVLAALVISVSAYFAHRRVDIMTVCFASSVIYFWPGLFPTYEVVLGAYAIYAFVLILIFTGALALDRLPVREACGGFSEKRILALLRGTLVLYLPLLVMALLTFETEAVVNKVEAGGGLIHYSLAVVLGYMSACALLLRRKIWILVAAVNYGWIILLGDRTQFVLAAFASLLLYASYYPIVPIEQFRKASFRNVAFAVSAAFVGLFGKDVYGAFFDYNSGLNFGTALFTRLSHSVDNPSSRFEPYHVQSILNLAIGNSDRVDPSYLLGAPLQLLPLATALGGDVHVQSQYVKNLYFADWSDQAGVSSNFFAEGYLSFGYAGAVFFCGLYVGISFALALILRKHGAAVRLWASFAGAYWAFYLHRSSLFQMIAHEKRVAYSILVIIILAAVVQSFRRLGQR